ncbi:sensor histidine kinase [Thalassobacterium maritimum]|uniref:sensor histidine kinase n=1 Tax=Thalassobacterium maritimum TaxID=3041265 RepID=UPI002810D6FF|nr:HAMP domain-containing sensor histidine kinase [Coraliomargarita sp. SDUM461003]
MIPPSEVSGFSIILKSRLNPDEYGEVQGSVCNDYDYKLEAEADKDGKVIIEVHRNEYDLSLIDPKVFDRKDMADYPFTQDVFKAGSWKAVRTFSELIPGFKDVDKESIFSQIGSFKFTLYFLKKTYSDKDVERFCYRTFAANNRKTWLDKYGGIKVFRDDFRVRPYGEAKGTSFDWLGLGARKAQSPASVAKAGGGYRVNPDNVAGSVRISRLVNVSFEDKSSREGLQENKVFLVFSKLLSGIISVFEQDRAHVAYVLNEFYQRKNAAAIQQKEAEELANRILGGSEEDSEFTGKEGESSDSPPKTDNEIVLAQAYRDKSEENERLRDEQKVLRGMASSGIIMASFSHDLSRLHSALGDRVTNLKEIIKNLIPEDDFKEVEKRKNPYVLMDRMCGHDSKLRNWLKFSLGAARKDKRNRRLILLQEYLKNLHYDWEPVFDERRIRFTFKADSDVGIRAFEIDLDSIFNNLIVNSVDAFSTSKIDRDREISIVAIKDSRNLVVEYSDTGPGLSEDIVNREEVFKPLFTTKRNQHTGDEEGTGLGMWLIKSIVEENGGEVLLLHPDEGFSIRFIFPNLKK